MKSMNILDNDNYQTICLSREEIKIFINHFKEMEFQDEKKPKKKSKKINHLSETGMKCFS